MSPRDPPGGGGCVWKRGSSVGGLDFGLFFGSLQFFPSKMGANDLYSDPPPPRRADSKSANFSVFLGLWSPCRSHADRLPPSWPDRSPPPPPGLGNGAHTTPPQG